MIGAGCKASCARRSLSLLGSDPRELSFLPSAQTAPAIQATRGGPSIPGAGPACRDQWPNLAVECLTALIAATDPVGATERRSERVVESIEQRAAGKPVMAIVSLHSQRITVAASAGDQAALMLLRKDST